MNGIAIVFGVILVLISLASEGGFLRHEIGNNVHSIKMVEDSATIPISPQLVGTKLKFERSSIKFNITKEDSVIIGFYFKFINTDHKPCVINKVESSVDWLAAAFSKAPIFPGEKEIISINFRPKDVDENLESQSIKVFIDDSDNPIILKVYFEYN